MGKPKSTRWDMRCVLLPDKQIPCDNHRETDHSLIRIGGSVLRHGPVGTIPRSSVSAAANSDICFATIQTSGLVSPIGQSSTDRDLTHTGLHTLHSIPISSPHINPSLDSSSPDSVIISIHQQTTSSTKKGASLADQDHIGTQEVSTIDIADKTTVSRGTIQTAPLGEERT